jgi:hypothetical protein
LTSSFVQPQSARREPSPGTAVVVGLIAVSTVLVLIVAGLTFVGLAIAFPIAVPVAAAYHLPVSAADAALAERFASIWWVFAALAVASFGGAAAIVVKLIGFLSPAPRD